MTEGDKVRLHAIIEGRVQGVGFRAFVIDKATDLGVTGWVRNRWDGSVELQRTTAQRWKNSWVPCDRVLVRLTSPR